MVGHNVATEVRNPMLGICYFTSSQLNLKALLLVCAGDCQTTLKQDVLQLDCWSSILL